MSHMNKTESFAACPAWQRKQRQKRVRSQGPNSEFNSDLHYYTLGFRYSLEIRRPYGA